MIFCIIKKIKLNDKKHYLTVKAKWKEKKRKVERKKKKLTVYPVVSITTL